MPVPIPPFEEQNAICEVLEACFGSADHLGEAVSSSHAELTQLDQSILARAFRGELVPQDPNDEPASVLLERIQRSREAASQTKTAKKQPRRKSKAKVDVGQ